ncbi:MAG: hypothetical protein K5930_07985 [Treponemataceae bacterium]|nr:hypothetical protein [Treponemataceae bacterium]
MKKTSIFFVLILCVAFILGCNNGMTGNGGEAPAAGGGGGNAPSVQVTPRTLLAKMPLSAQEMAQGQSRTAVPVTNADLAAYNTYRSTNTIVPAGLEVMMYLCLLKNDLAATQNFQFNSNVAVGRIQSVSDATKANLRSIGATEDVVSSVEMIFTKMNLGTVFFKYENNKFTVFWNLPEQTITYESPTGQQMTESIIDQTMYIEGNLENNRFVNCRFVGFRSEDGVTVTMNEYIYAENNKVIEECTFRDLKSRTVYENSTSKKYNLRSQWLYGSYQDTNCEVQYSKNTAQNYESYFCFDANGNEFYRVDCDIQDDGSVSRSQQYFPLRFLTVSEGHTLTRDGAEGSATWRLDNDENTLPIFFETVLGSDQPGYYVYLREGRNKKDTSPLEGGKLVFTKMNNIAAYIDKMDFVAEFEADSSYSHVTTAVTQEYVTKINNWVASLSD